MRFRAGGRLVRYAAAANDAPRRVHAVTATAAAPESVSNDGPVESPEEYPDVPVRRMSIRRMVVEATAVTALSISIFLVIYWPFGGRHAVLFSYGLDALFYAMLVRTITLHGGYGDAPELGAPFGQNLYDFPQGGDRLHLFIERALTVVTDDPMIVVNMYFALGFVLVALSAYLVLRLRRVGPLVAGLASVLFAFLPYHLWRGEQHLTLSAYFAVPIGVLVAIWAIEGGLPLTPSSWKTWPPRQRNRRLLGLAACVVVLGSSNSYYAVLAVLLILGAGLISALHRGELRPAISAAVICASIGLVLVINLAPEIKYRLDHGANPEVGQRSVPESETYGLHLTQMLVPQPSHRVDLLAKAGVRARAVEAPGEGGSYLGMIGVGGFILGVLAAFGLRVGGGTREPLIRRLGQLMLVALLVGTVGGLGFSIAVLGFTQIRSWGRIVVFIGFMALAVMALIGSRWLETLRTGRSKVLAGAGLVLLTSIGLLDQVPGDARPNYAVGEVYQAADTEFFADMEAALPDGAMVFQLPVMSFPEHPPLGDVGSYDHLRGYILGSNELRWSAGGMAGREADWQETWETQPVDRMVEGLAAAGFDALYLDRWAYPDHGASLHGELLPITGPPAGESAYGRMRWYDLRGVENRLSAELSDEELEELRRAIFAPLEVLFDGIFAEEVGADGPFRWMTTEASIVLENRGEDSREVILRLTPIGVVGSTLHVHGPGIDGSDDLPVGQPAEVRFRLPQGTTTVDLSTDAPAAVTSADGQPLSLQLIDLSVTDAAVEGILGS